MLMEIYVQAKLREVDGVRLARRSALPRPEAATRRAAVWWNAAFWARAFGVQRPRTA